MTKILVLQGVLGGTLNSVDCQRFSCWILAVSCSTWPDEGHRYAKCAGLRCDANQGSSRRYPIIVYHHPRNCITHHHHIIIITTTRRQWPSWLLGIDPTPSPLASSCSKPKSALPSEVFSRDSYPSRVCFLAISIWGHVSWRFCFFFFCSLALLHLSPL